MIKKLIRQWLGSQEEYESALAQDVQGTIASPKEEPEIEITPEQQAMRDAIALLIKTLPDGDRQQEGFYYTRSHWYGVENLYHVYLAIDGAERTSILLTAFYSSSPTSRISFSKNLRNCVDFDWSAALNKYCGIMEQKQKEAYGTKVSRVKEYCDRMAAL